MIVKHKVIYVSRNDLRIRQKKGGNGSDAVLLIDSNKTWRAYNAIQNNSGRTLSGGLDIRALEIPKKIFGSARKIEGGGSLTIIATCLVETNSRMDDLILRNSKEPEIWSWFWTENSKRSYLSCY